MPVTPTYPGVDIQEIDSGSRVVTGVVIRVIAGPPLEAPASLDLKTDDPKYTLAARVKRRDRKFAQAKIDTVKNADVTLPDTYHVTLSAKPT